MIVDRKLALRTSAGHLPAVRCSPRPGKLPEAYTLQRKEAEKGPKHQHTHEDRTSDGIDDG